MSGHYRQDGHVLCFGELLLRLSAPRGELLLQSPALHTCIGGAEANVAVSLARFGHEVAMAGVLPDNPLGHAARDALRGHGVDTRPLVFQPGRMGLYFLTPGAVQRPAEIVYDRAGSAFAQYDPTRYDWPALLRGASLLHLSGVTPALGGRAAQAALAAARAACELGVPVSFDGNYRASLWAAQGQDGAAVLAELMRHVDLAFAGQRDIALLLGRPELADVERQTQAVAAAFQAFPRLRHLACTVRVQHGVERHELSAQLHTRDASLATAARTMDGIVDRIGAGDAFAAGLLHGLRRRWPAARALEFALAAATVKHAIAGDFNLASEAQVLAADNGGLDVRR
ncbi:sugar kinase [Duganella violaceipulchra]|uniref:2-dehydro-3-deoxygluconokinase n=1 Tax=Duganella violaceipulchra TaxID=2849652 RepID=A0AA41H4G0_9BURK|nr:sugar kinase [Duganella violaceicalia]MBV6319469.1 sugar kinase [Duganella violaceicalia]MCP2006720.1 2-dehydro-3-deoxygluconokinase [Duganella violaceicalia]